MTYRVAVRALCEFTAKRGDLDLRFTPPHGPGRHRRPRPGGGPAGRRLPARSALAGAFGPLQVRGRADGYDPTGNRLEEVKTHRGDLARQPDNHRHLHWAQVRVYGWLLCAERGLDEVELALVYLDVASQKETTFTTRASAAELRAFFEAQCQAFLAWAEQELAHQARRDGALQALRFPHASFRLGQRELAEAVYKAASTGCCLMAQAPTGIGKTLATLFPQLKALGGGRLERLFFLAAKTPGRQLALHSLATLRDSVDALPVRVLELTARDKACEYPGSACHGDACPWHGASTTACRLPAKRLRNGAGWTAPPCARWHWPTTSAPITWARRWRAGATSWWGTTTTTSTSALCSSALPSSTSGKWACWWTKPTIWWSAPAPCTAPSCARAR